jgi:hypothetical protein
MKNLNVELQALDLETCDRCEGSSANLKKAIVVAAPVLAALGTNIVLTETVVTDARQADRLRFASSPTIRIDGVDIVSEKNETVCGACSDLCGCSGGVECRVWPWKGVNHETAPLGLIVEALVRAAVVPETRPPTPRWNGVPQNLLTYFEGRQSIKAGASSSVCGCAST